MLPRVVLLIMGCKPGFPMISRTQAWTIRPTRTAPKESHAQLYLSALDRVSKHGIIGG